jgi:hypothetical protein
MGSESICYKKMTLRFMICCSIVAFLVLPSFITVFHASSTVDEVVSVNSDSNDPFIVGSDEPKGYDDNSMNISGSSKSFSNYLDPSEVPDDLSSGEWDGIIWTNTSYYFTTVVPLSLGTSPGPTEPQQPGSFKAETYNCTQINLSWTKGTLADYTRIQRKTGGYPTSISDGTNVYNGTGSSCSDSGLSVGTTYYYRAWSWNMENNQWSTSYASAYNTTNNIATMASESPTNQSTNVDPLPLLSISVNDLDGDTMTITWRSNTVDRLSSPWQVFGTNSSVSNGTYTMSNSNFNSYNTIYYWNVTVTDGKDTNTSNIFNFTTRGQYIPSSPSSFTATTYNRTRIDLIWGNSGVNTTRLEWNTSATWSVGTGELLDNSTNTFYNHTNLNPGTTYYYRAWSYNATDNCYSTAASSANNITLLNSEPTIGDPSPENESINVSLFLSNVSVTISDIDNELLSWNITVSTGDYANGSVQGNDTISCDLIVPISYDTTITWYVNVSDGFTWVNRSYVFNLTCDGNRYLWHTFYGNSTEEDRAYGIAKDNNGDIYVVGRSKSSWTGPYGQEPLNAYSGNHDIMVLKLDSNGEYVWHTFYGAARADYGFDVAIGEDHSVYVAGFSDDSWDGPGNEPPINAYAGERDVVVLKLNSTGGYQWHTFYGSVDYYDEVQGIALDEDGNAYVAIKSYYTWKGTGDTLPMNPYSGGGDAGNQTDIAVLKLNSTGVYQWHTFLGSTDFNGEDNPGEEPTSIAVDDSSNVYVAGFCIGSWNGTGNQAPIHDYSGGNNDAFMLKLNSTGGYQWHTLYGSINNDWVNGICVSNGEVYATGFSGASWNGTGNQTPLNAYSGNHDIMVIKLNNTGSYQWHTFYGSDSENDYGLGIVHDNFSGIYVTGRSYANWKADGGANPENAFSGNSDIFILKLNDAGAYNDHTFFGSSANDWGQDIILDSNNRIYVTGYSADTWNGVCSQEPINPYEGNTDIIVLKTLPSSYIPDPPENLSASSSSSSQISLTWLKGERADKTIVRYNQGSTAPVNVTNGTLLYNDTGISTNATGLFANTQYSFTAWSYNDTRGYYSLFNDTCNATTSSSSGSGGTVVKNSPPVADANGPYSSLVNRTIMFDGSQSSDSDGTITSYVWVFGDGSTRTGVLVSHQYASVGVYTVRLTVTDDDGATGTDMTTATITEDMIEGSNNTIQQIEQIYNISLPENFYATDIDGDGMLDSFTDPNEILQVIQFTMFDDKELILLSVNGDLDQMFLWDINNNSFMGHVNHSIGTSISEDINESANTITMTIEVEKANWTYFEIEDPYPELTTLIIQTTDGRTIDSDCIWRENGTIYVLDDPSIFYELIYTQFLFDITVEITKDTVSVGEPLEALIELINVGTPGLINTAISYMVYNDTTLVWSEVEDIAVSSRLVFNKTILTQDLQIGSYTLKVIHIYGFDQSTEATVTFTVTEPSGGIPWIWISIITVIVGVLVIFAFLIKKGIILLGR